MAGNGAACAAAVGGLSAEGSWRSTLSGESSPDGKVLTTLSLVVVVGVVSGAGAVVSMIVASEPVSLGSSAVVLVSMGSGRMDLTGLASLADVSVFGKRLKKK